MAEKRDCTIISLQDRRRLSQEECDRVLSMPAQRDVVDAVKSGSACAITESFGNACRSAPASAFDVWLPVGSPEADAYLFEQYTNF